MHLYRVIERHNLSHELNCQSIKKNVANYERPGHMVSTIHCCINTNFVFLDKTRTVTLARALDQYFQRKLDEHRDAKKGSLV